MIHVLRLCCICLWLIVAILMWLSSTRMAFVSWDVPHMLQEEGNDVCRRVNSVIAALRQERMTYLQVCSGSVFVW